MIYMDTYVYLSINISIYLYIYISIYLYIYLLRTWANMASNHQLKTTQKRRRRGVTTPKAREKTKKARKNPHGSRRRHVIYIWIYIYICPYIFIYSWIYIQVARVPRLSSSLRFSLFPLLFFLSCPFFSSFFLSSSCTKVEKKKTQLSGRG